VPWLRCGSIHADDQLLSVDSIPLDTCTVGEAERLLLRTADAVVRLRVRKRCAAEEDLEPTAGHALVYSLELSRRAAPLGLTLASTDDSADPIIVSHIAPGSLVDRCATCPLIQLGLTVAGHRVGAIHVGDRILAINGQSTSGKRVAEAVQLMQQNSDAVSFKIARFVGVQPESHFPPGAPEHYRQVEVGLI